MAMQQLHTYCAMCVSRCGVVATVEDGILTKVSRDPAHPNGCICVKGSAWQRRCPRPRHDHVLLEEDLYDKTFVREWTNGAFLVRADNQQLL